MILSDDIEFAGITAFPNGSGTTIYRYVIALKGKKLSFSMEDRSSKKQWFKGGIDKADFVTTDNTISGASAVDYLECFIKALSCSLGSSNESQRKLCMLSGDVLEVELVLKLRVLCSSWDATFQFQLGPVSLERIDILESKLRDQQDEIAELKTMAQEQEEQLINLQSIEATIVELESTRTDCSSNALIWTSPVEPNGLVTCYGDGVLTFRRSGIYNVCPIVKCAPLHCGNDMDDEDQNARLLKNGECLEVDFLVEACSLLYPETTARFQKGDELTVTTTCKITGTSTLFIARLGN